MCLWSVALKARKAAKWPRTFYMVWTVVVVATYSGFSPRYSYGSICANLSAKKLSLSRADQNAIHIHFFSMKDFFSAHAFFNVLRRINSYKGRNFSYFKSQSSNMQSKLTSLPN